MRHSPRTLALLAAVTAAATLSGCSSSGGTHAGSTSAASNPASASASTGVGAIQTLRSSSGSLVVNIQLIQVLPTAKGTKGNRPARGKRYFAAKLTIRNIGTDRLKEKPWTSTTVTDAKGHKYATATVTGITAGAEMPVQVRAVHGRSRTGWIVFEVPKTAKITGLAYRAPASGLDDSAAWTF